MARYPGTESERRIEPDLLKRQIAFIFTGCGMSDADASLLADSLSANSSIKTIGYKIRTTICTTKMESLSDATRRLLTPSRRSR